MDLKVTISNIFANLGMDSTQETMNARSLRLCRSQAWIPIVTTLLLCSCGQRGIPPELVGEWKSDMTRITVRTEPEKRIFEFASDSANITLHIKSDHSVTGTIGTAKITNGIITTNWLLPVKMSGLAFTIKCGSIGKIFESDPLDAKEVELWLGPLEEVFEAELRYTENGAQFPMAGMVFHKIEE